jgi:hypothetical protein
MFDKKKLDAFKRAVRAYLRREVPARTTGREAKILRWELKMQRRQLVRSKKKLIGGRRLSVLEMREALGS